MNIREYRCCHSIFRGKSPVANARTVLFKVFDVTDSTDVLLLFIDTTPMVDLFRYNDEHPDALKQSVEDQLSWIDSTLGNSRKSGKL